MILQSINVLEYGLVFYRGVRIGRITGPPGPFGNPDGGNANFSRIPMRLRLLEGAGVHTRAGALGRDELRQYAPTWRSK